MTEHPKTTHGALLLVVSGLLATNGYLTQQMIGSVGQLSGNVASVQADIAALKASDIRIEKLEIAQTNIQEIQFQQGEAMARIEERLSGQRGRR